MSLELEEIDRRIAALNDEITEAKRERDLAKKQAGSFPNIDSSIITISRAKSEIRALELQRTAIVDRETALEAARRHTIDAERERQAGEDEAFWFRRFFTTLGIANAAAFAAIASGFLQAASADRLPVARPVADALSYFSFGMVCAGAIPAFLWLRAAARRIHTLKQVRFFKPQDLQDFVTMILFLGIYFAAAFSVLGLAKGIGIAIGAVRGLAGG
jgi:hypothetical protein